MLSWEPLVQKIVRPTLNPTVNTNAEGRAVQVLATGASEGEHDGPRT